jgi:predicted metal-dependent peptidase
MDHIDLLDNAQELTCLTYFTDGYCDDFGRNPGVPVLWVLTHDSNDRFTPPFGKVVKMMHPAYEP